MNSCEEIRERLLANDSSARSHISECASCAEFEADLKKARGLMGEVEELALRPGLAREIQARVRPKAFRWPLAIAAVMILGIAIGFLWQHTTAPDPELVRTELAEHLQVSRLFFRQAENVERPEEIAVELQATRLAERTDRLMKHSTDPHVKEYLAAVQKALNQDFGAIRRQARDLYERTSDIEMSTGIQAKSVEVSMPEDPFLQARANLYRGEYEQAEKRFRELNRSDARYWQGFAANRQGKNVEALRSWSGLPKSWLDQETLEQLRELTVRMNAKFGERPAREVKPEEIRKLFQSKPCVMVLKSANHEPIVTMGRTMTGGLPKGMPGFNVRTEGETTWIEIDLDKLMMSEQEKEALIKIIKMSMSRD
jgi:tetratricopeptide (TPR) repeat protein